MQREGPILESLTRRLAETPADFLAEPRIGASGEVHVVAVVNDLTRILGASFDAKDLRIFVGNDPRKDRNRLSIALLLVWLLADENIRQLQPELDRVWELLSKGSEELAAQVASTKFVNDPDRREELVRFALARLDFRPAGESVAQAQDRLTTVSSVERTRVMRAAREAEQRARSIREALVKKAAEESADKWTRD